MPRPQTCTSCGQQVRWGWRPTTRQPVPSHPAQGYWMHRNPTDDVDHGVVLGQPVTPEAAAEVQRQLDLPRTKLNAKGELVTYTTRTFQQKKTKTAEGDAGEEGKVDDSWDGALPEPEVVADLSVVPWPLREALPNGAWLVLKPALAAKMTVARATYARGPWLHAGGQRPHIQETWVISVLADWIPEVAPEPRAAVGCWRKVKDKWQFDHGGLITGNTLQFCPSADIKAWIKEVPRGESP